MAEKILPLNFMMMSLEFMFSAKDLFAARHFWCHLVRSGGGGGGASVFGVSATSGGLEISTSDADAVWSVDSFNACEDCADATPLEKHNAIKMTRITM
jgi:hypothetical protein